LFEQRYLTNRFPSPLGIEELRNIPIVNAAAFLKAGPSMLLTSLDSEQADILLDLLRQRNPGEVPRTLALGSSSDAALSPIADVLALRLKEGGKKLFIHYARERNPRLIRAKREAVLATTGGLACEVCKFDFGRRYGALGEDFCEVHHKEPLRKLKAEAEVSTDDLAIVCSNCHRMIHKGGVDVLSIDDLRKILRDT